MNRDITKPTDPAFGSPLTYGLTKREYFAALAMQGLADNDESLLEIARTAVEIADYLIAALNEKK